VDGSFNPPQGPAKTAQRKDLLFLFFAQDIHRRRIILRLSQCPGSAISLAAFQVSTDGRFWVSAEARYPGQCNSGHCDFGTQVRRDDSSVPGAAMKLDRRRFLGSAAGLAATTGTAAEWLWPKHSVSFKKPCSSVAILDAVEYSEKIEALLMDGLRRFHLKVLGKTVLLKPNLVEDVPGPVNTSATLVGATARSFLRLGAARVVIGEGPGHQRDTELVVQAAGLTPHLNERQIEFVDLNRDELRKVRLRASYSGLHELWLPHTVLASDFVVSMPKVKTHHWAGVTLSLKNMFGIVPGMKYGWPKNVLHWHGIHESILDICATVPIHFVIADGITAMEGNGPLQGSAHQLGKIVLADDPVAADATCPRLMGFDPLQVRHISEAGQFLGNLREDRITMLGEEVSVTKQVKRKPGASPLLFGKFLMELGAFVSLEDISGELPAYREEVIGVDMDEALAKAYADLEKQIKEALEEHRGNHSVLSTALNALLAYPDRPYGFGDLIGTEYDPERHRREPFLIAHTQDLSEDVVYAKERQLIEHIKEDLSRGRKCQVYAVYTGKRDVTGRLERILSKEGIRVSVLTTQVPPDQREAWYERQLRNGKQVCIAHPASFPSGWICFGRHRYILFRRAIRFIRCDKRAAVRGGSDSDLMSSFAFFPITRRCKRPACA